MTYILRDGIDSLCKDYNKIYTLFSVAVLPRSEFLYKYESYVYV